MSVLVTASGDPLPPSDILRRLERVGQSVGTVFRLKWSRFGGYWTVQAEWKANDRRREKIQSGEIADDPFDIVATFRDAANVDEAFSQFVAGLRSYNADFRDDLVKTLDYMDAWNNDVLPDKLADKAIEPILDDVTSLAGRRLTGTAASFGGIGKGRRRKKADQ